MNDLQHHGETLEHRVVPKADHAKAVAFQERGAGLIVLDLVSMLSAVELDHQAMLPATEIHDVRADRLLAAKFRSCKLPTAKSTPEFALRVGLVGPQLTCAVTELC